MTSRFYHPDAIIKCLGEPAGLCASQCITFDVKYFYFFLIQFNVPFKIISLIETSQSVGGAKREYPGKTT